ncbi:hypothetical protein DRJ48_02620 [Candidatus Woesearchaeota archaeon]|nr:hypothetical protein [Candidatus Woesearchaeota archaeon]RLE42845.1 MAG: hypothetical protein DRJ48_02620 [Candidatus Woesearchaeota archaeon]
MSLYIKIEEPKSTRKALLVGKINVLNALKRCEEHNEIRAKLKTRLQELNSILSSLPEKIDEIKGMLPVVDVGKVGFAAGRLRCEMCGKFFKTERGLRLHMSKQHPVETTKKEEVESAATALDRIEKQIEMIEKEMTQL